MIVQPDFLDHWKTRMLVDVLKDPCAPLYVIRLWANCQNRKTHGLPSDNPAITKAICQAPHDAKFFHNAMLSVGFIEEIDGKVYAHEWDNVNSYLVNSWENGKKGGRPRKETQTKPTGYPRATQSEPIREEKINNREDKKTSRERFSKPTVQEVAAYVAETVKDGKPNIDAESFVNFYESKGWRVGNTPMKSWKHAIGTWQSNRSKEQLPSKAFEPPTVHKSAEEFWN